MFLDTHAYFIFKIVEPANQLNGHLDTSLPIRRSIQPKQLSYVIGPTCWRQQTLCWINQRRLIVWTMISCCNGCNSALVWPVFIAVDSLLPGWLHAFKSLMAANCPLSDHCYLASYKDLFWDLYCTSYTRLNSAKLSNDMAYSCICMLTYIPVSVSINDTVRGFAACITDVDGWTSASRLPLSPTKTRVMWLVCFQWAGQLDWHCWYPGHVMSTQVRVVDSACEWPWGHPQLADTMVTSIHYVDLVFYSSNYYNTMFTVYQCCHTLAQAFVLCCLDYCGSLLYGVSDALFGRYS